MTRSIFGLTYPAGEFWLTEAPQNSVNFFICHLLLVLYP